MAANLDGLARSGELGRLAVEHGPALAAGLAVLVTAKLQVSRNGCTGGVSSQQRAELAADEVARTCQAAQG